MNIEMIDPEAATPADLLAHIGLLDDDAQETLRQMTIVIISTLIHKTGTAILMADIKGDGIAQIIAAGNPALVPPLLYTASEAADAMFKRPAESTAQ
jgi:hypothetical protein